MSRLKQSRRRPQRLQDHVGPSDNVHIANAQEAVEELPTAVAEDEKASPQPKKRRTDQYTGLQLLPGNVAPQAQLWVIAKVLLEQQDCPDSERLRALALVAHAGAGLHLGFEPNLENRSCGSKCIVVDSNGSTLEPLGFLDFPSAAAAQALNMLLKSGKICLQLGLSGSSRGTREMLVALTDESFVSLSDGSEVRTGHSGKHWLEVVSWLLPEQAASTHFPGSQSADPAQAGPSTLPADGHAEHQLSPRSHAAAHSQDGMDAAGIYRAVRPTGQEPELQGSFPKFTVQLRPYQRRAAAWMVSRERQPPEADAHPLWRKVPALDTQGTHQIATVQFNPYSGCFSHTEPPPPPPLHGGILADEMGLGKTVEVLACVMANAFAGPAYVAEQGIQAAGREARERVECVCGAVTEKEGPDLWVQCDSCLAWQHADCVGFSKGAPEGDYECGQCQKARANVKISADCGATLIICPRTIFKQWQQEIDKHIQPGTLKVLTYEGQSRKPGKKVVTAAHLAAADIVLTTYDVLSKDIYHQPDPSEETYSLRHKKKYEVLATPLTRLMWWRVCLDEAQLVENGTVAAARLASKIQARHRWAVTGTPINSSIQDLFGLLSFLKSDPYGNDYWWHRVCQGPYEQGCLAGWARVVQVLRPGFGGLLWRSSKQDVAGELQLPPQEHTFTPLQMSDIERHFYSTQHEWCYNHARSVLDSHIFFKVQSNRNMSDSEVQRRLHPREEKALLAPLLRLRQACCHPQVGAGGLKGLHGRNKPMTMEQILAMFIERSKGEAQEAQRLLLFALNGLAALASLENNPARAITNYREALKVSEANKEHIKADSLQLLHTMHNLALLLGPDGQRPEGVAPTLRDTTLQADAGAIRDRYMAQWWAKLAAAEKDFQDSGAQLERASLSSDGSLAPSLLEGGSWYLEAVECLETHSEDRGAQAIARIKDQLAEMNSDNTRLTRNATSLAKRLRGAQSVKLVLNEELSAMEAARKAALEELAKLGHASRQLKPDLVEQAGQCGRCRSDLGQAGRVCAHCKLDELLMGWELRLFSLQTHAVNKRDSVTAEDALRQAQTAALRRVGRGGLGEDQEFADAEAQASTSKADDARRGDQTGVAYADVVHHPSEAEQILKLLISQLRSLRRLPAAVAKRREEILAEGKVQLDRLEVMRKFFVKSRALSLAQREILYAKDELEMCTMRMRLRTPGERVKPTEAHFILHPAEVPVKVKELTADEITAEADLQKTLGTLRYLEGLKAAREQESKEAGMAEQADAENKIACPVCHEPLKGELVMLPCGHALCYQCSEKLCQHGRLIAGRQSRRVLLCPTCRQEVQTSQLAYARPGKPAEELPLAKSGTELSVHVQGSYGTKLEAVIRRIKWLIGKGSQNKVLIFSSWTDVLDVLSHGLAENGVHYKYARSQKQLDNAIAELQQAAKGKSIPPASKPLQTILLPIKQGANGLNLTEAQHVILVEPLLDPAVEAQAVSRVHRIGQRQKTFVHNFVCDDTVEQNVFKLNRERAASIDVSAIAANRASKTDQQFTVRDVALLLEKPWTKPSQPAAAPKENEQGVLHLP